MSNADHELDSYVANFERAYLSAEDALDHWLEDVHARLARPPVMECSFLFIDQCYYVVVHVTASQDDGPYGGELHVRVDRTFAVVECLEDVHLVDAHQEVSVSEERQAEVGVITGLVDAGTLVQVGILTANGQLLWLCADGNLFRRAEREYVESRENRAQSLVGATIPFARTDWGGLDAFALKENS